MDEGMDLKAVYLDHSVIDLLRKGKPEGDVEPMIASVFHVFYSPDNIAEIRGSKDVPGFCALLERLDGWFMSLNPNPHNSDEECKAQKVEPASLIDSPTIGVTSDAEDAFRELIAYGYGVSDQA